MWIALCRPLQWFWKGVTIGLMWLHRFVSSHTVFTNMANVREGLALWPGYQLKLKWKNKPRLSGCSSQCLAWGRGGNLSHMEPRTCWGLALTQRSSTLPSFTPALQHSHCVRFSLSQGKRRQRWFHIEKHVTEIRNENHMSQPGENRNLEIIKSVQEPPPGSAAARALTLRPAMGLSRSISKAKNTTLKDFVRTRPCDPTTCMCSWAREYLRQGISVPGRRSWSWLTASSSCHLGDERWNGRIMCTRHQEGDAGQSSRMKYQGHTDECLKGVSFISLPR